jgi:hypothetical protein
VQFGVSTHSSHVANAAGFEAIRYFLPAAAQTPGVYYTRIKDLHDGLRETAEDHRKFLHQYLTLTRCDLFFADKAILVEGTSERLLLPVIIRKLEEADANAPKLSSQYLTMMEVGGAYAHLFFSLLDFLELPTLVITDLDSVTVPGGAACPAHGGTATSNACLKKWFSGNDCSPVWILARPDSDKIKNLKRIAYQRPEAPNGPCGRTFEDAFMLANAAMYEGLQGTEADELENIAYGLTDKIKKSEFALKHAIYQTDWTPPGYILDGLKWLATSDPSVPRPQMDSAPNATDAPTQGSTGDRND